MTKEEILALERIIHREEQALLNELHAVKARHREQIAGTLRSYGLEEVRRTLRKWAREAKSAVVDYRAAMFRQGGMRM
jgi:hypothetical protein